MAGGGKAAITPSTERFIPLPLPLSAYKLISHVKYEHDMTPLYRLFVRNRIPGIGNYVLLISKRELYTRA